MLCASKILKFYLKFDRIKNLNIAARGHTDDLCSVFEFRFCKFDLNFGILKFRVMRKN